MKARLYLARNLRHGFMRHAVKVNISADMLVCAWPLAGSRRACRHQSRGPPDHIYLSRIRLLPNYSLAIAYLRARRPVWLSL